ncbi:signal peptidase [Paraburkholderia aromaticivorans]|uniref:Signal peptidase n=1 Tax=Paraburkholderia aromaticivorans TaxID=2026199 RepID=A0A248VHC2_9BURK|nr:signal peptidase [Paraburkholderia aromaticivorans]ASV98426.1 signal peptidase [Paraburkholderia aromaticivorans]
MKRIAVLGALAIVALTQTGCATQVKSLPLAAAGGESRGGVPVYFGQQDHPAVKTQLGDVSYSVRIARKVAGPDEACHEALAEAVRKLRAAANERHANAVVDVSTRFHSTESNSSTDFTCGVSPSAAAIAVKGQLVVLDSN